MANAHPPSIAKTADPVFSLIDEDPAIGQLTPYSVGWLREMRDDEGRQRRLVPSGSGVLIEVGGIKGVLTAGHVVRKVLARTPQAGVALFTIVRKRGRVRPLEFHVEECRSVTIGGATEDPMGPDLGFVRLPQRIEQRLVDENLFYNFDRRLRSSEASSEKEPPLPRSVIVGVVAEKSEQTAVSKTSRTDAHVMVHAYGARAELRDGNSGLDIFDLSLLHNGEVSRPHSYGGLSGAGVWVVGDEPGWGNRMLFGLAFFESGENNNGERSVICHGPRSIYVNLVDEISRAFPDFRRPSE